MTSARIHRETCRRNALITFLLESPCGFRYGLTGDPLGDEARSVSRVRSHSSANAGPLNSESLPIAQ